MELPKRADSDENLSASPSSSVNNSNPSPRSAGTSVVNIQSPSLSGPGTAPSPSLSCPSSSLLSVPGGGNTKGTGRRDTRKSGSSGMVGLEKTVAIEIEREEEGGITRSEGLNVVEKLTIALLGGGATGKSSLIVRMLRNEFEEHDVNDPTLLDEYHLDYHFENRTYHLTILDTAGQEQYYDHRRESIEEAKGYLLVYDVTQRVSFEEIEAFVNELCRVRFKDTKDLPIVIVGNKGDVPEEEREVSKEEAIRFAEENGCPLIEASARTGKNVQKVLDKLLQEITYYHTKAIRGVMWKMKGAFTTPSIRIKGRLKWTKYYVVLDRENFSWFSSKNKSNPRGFIPLSTVVGCSKVVIKKKRQPIYLDVPTIREAEKETQKSNSLLIKSLYTCFFYTDTEEERDMWINEIRIHASKTQQEREIGTGDEIVRTLDGTLVEEEINFDPDSLKERSHELVEVKAIKAYKSKMGSELSFTKGQVITVLKADGERYKGVLGRRKGWFPKSHVVEINTPSDSLSHGASGQQQAIVGPPSNGSATGGSADEDTPPCGGGGGGSSNNGGAPRSPGSSDKETPSTPPAEVPTAAHDTGKPSSLEATGCTTGETANAEPAAATSSVPSPVAAKEEPAAAQQPLSPSKPEAAAPEDRKSRKKSSRTLLDKITSKGGIMQSREPDKAASWGGTTSTSSSSSLNSSGGTEENGTGSPKKARTPAAKEKDPPKREKKKG